VIGSGAGGGIVAARLAELGHEVILLEAGGHHRAESHNRFEVQALRNLWNPPRFATTGPHSPPIVMVSGRGVGGSTLINTKVGVRAIEQDYAKWFEASGLLGEDGRPFGDQHLARWYQAVEERMRVRLRTDWTHSVRVVEKGFQKMGASLQPVTSYTDENCSRCGSCTLGCPSNAGSTTLNRYIHQALLTRRLEVRPNSTVSRIRTRHEGGTRKVSGVEYRDDSGSHRLDADIIVLAAGSLVTPQLLQLSGLADLNTPSSALIGRTLGTHTARMVHGIFDEVMDAHVVYPLTAHCADFAEDSVGGFVVEATTLLDPIGLATNLVDEEMRPLCGAALTTVMARYRHMAGLFMMTNDSNVGCVDATDDLIGSFAVDMPAADHERLASAYQFCIDVLREAGAKETIATGYLTSHMQGSCRMGSDHERSVCDPDQQLWDVENLYLADGSVIPRTLTYNPSLTIMALAERLAAHLHRRLRAERLPVPDIDPPTMDVDPMT
jgi:choline dehydrogenase-like flavoprotein